MLLKHGLFKAPGKIHAVRNVSLRLRRGKTLGLASESGCGKSTLVKMLLDSALTPEPGLGLPTIQFEAVLAAAALSLAPGTALPPALHYTCATLPLPKR